jgi:uncharacterized protein (DUF1015 family)
MAELRPFRALKYHADAGPIDSLIAPLHHDMTPAERDAYASKSPYNIVHLTVPEGKPNDRSKFVKYARSAAALSQWRREEILVLGSQPAFYCFTQIIEDASQTTLFGLLKIDSSVTHAEPSNKPKEDRLRLLEATRANLEPVLAICENPGSINKAPNRLQSITDQAEIAAIQAQLAPQNIRIVDNADTFDAAVAFRQELGPREQMVPEDYLLVALHAKNTLSYPKILSGLALWSLGDF